MVRLRAGRSSTSGRQTISPRRLEAYTDGVFAIAATILVLDLSVGEIGRVGTDPEMWSALAKLMPTIINMAVSFLLLGLLWNIHIRQFEYIDAIDGTVIWWNNVRLLGVVLIPFTTSLNNEFSDVVVGRMLLPTNVLFIMLIGFVQWVYATNSTRDLTPRLTTGARYNTRASGVIALVTSVGVVALSAAIGSLAFLLFALLPLAGALRKRLGFVRPEPEDEPEDRVATAR